MTKTKNAINFPSTCVVFPLWWSSHWDWFSAFYLQQKLNIKKWLYWNPSLICQVTFDFVIGVFSKPSGDCTKWWGQILPNLTFRIQKCLIQVQSQVKSRSLTHETFFLHNGTCILPEIQPAEICKFWVQNVKLGKIWPRHFNGLEKT